VGAGAGGGPELKVIDGTKLSQVGSNGVILNSALLYDFFAYPATFNGGVFVAAGDFNNDGKADIITGAGAGGGPEVRFFNGANTVLLADFYAYASTFTGGVRVASADVDGDLKADIIVGPGSGGGPEVKVIRASNQALLYDFFAFDPSVTGGVFVAAADLDGDGKAEIIASTGSGAPIVRSFSGLDSHLLASFTPAIGNSQGARVSVADRDGGRTGRCGDRQRLRRCVEGRDLQRDKLHAAER